MFAYFASLELKPLAERFIKYKPGPRADALRQRNLNAFVLLHIIAEKACRKFDPILGLHPGECLLGNWKSYGMTEQNYRTAKSILEELKLIVTIETNRTRKLTTNQRLTNKKTTTGLTTKGTKVKLIDSSIWDINLEEGNDLSNDQLTINQRKINDEQEERKKEDKEPPTIPSSKFGGGGAKAKRRELSQEEKKVLENCLSYSSKKKLDLTEPTIERLIRRYGLKNFKKAFKESDEYPGEILNFPGFLTSKLKEGTYG